MSDVIEVLVKHRDMVSADGWRGFEMFLCEAGTEREVSSDEVRRRFQNLTITGIYVKPKKEGGVWGIVTDIRPEYIEITESFGVNKILFPREEFHAHHQLD